MIFNALLGLLIFGFIAWQGWLVARYSYLRLVKPDIPRKFPVLALLIFIFCCGFYVVAFIADFGDDLFSSSPVATPTNFISQSTIHPTITPGTNCHHWSDITPQMAGREICVYGIVQSLYSTQDSWTRIKFTDAPNTFFINDTSYIYELQVGDCISVKHIVRLYENIPYMEASSVGLYDCK